MKKQIKKLTLSKETILALEETDLTVARGAASGFITICGCQSRIRPCFNTEQGSCTC